MSVNRTAFKYSYAIGADFQNYVITGLSYRKPNKHTYFPTKCKQCGHEYEMTKKQLLSKLAQQTTHCRSCAPKGNKNAYKGKTPDLYLLPEIGMKFIHGKL